MRELKKEKNREGDGEEDFEAIVGVVVDVEVGVIVADREPPGHHFCDWFLLCSSSSGIGFFLDEKAKSMKT